MARRSVLSIAGSDPSGGAGVQADVRVFEAFGCHGMGVVAALTVQDTGGVVSVTAVKGSLVASQLEALFADCPPAAAKTGMLASPGGVEAVAASWRRHPQIPLVVDPVLRASSGQPLFSAQARRALVRDLLPVARLVTPNAAEAAELADVPVVDLPGAVAAARLLLARGARAVLVKGGHLDSGATVTDVLVERDLPPRVFERARIRTPRRVHGTGCALSAAVAAGLARSLDLRAAVELAGRYVHEAIRGAYEVGRGALAPDLSTRAPEMPW